jgi:hypothetical protein
MACGCMQCLATSPLRTVTSCACVSPIANYLGASTECRSLDSLGSRLQIATNIAIFKEPLPILACAGRKISSQKNIVISEQHLDVAAHIPSCSGLLALGTASPNTNPPPESQPVVRQYTRRRRLM